MHTETQKKTPTAINTFSNGVGYEINTQKSATFLHANSKHTEKEIREIISFTIASSKKKWNKSNQRGEKCLQQKLWGTEEDSKDARTGNVNAREIVFLPKAIGRFRSVHQTANAIFTEIGKIILTSIWSHFWYVMVFSALQNFSVLCLLYYFLCLRGFILVVNSKHFKDIFGLFITFY